MITLINKAVHAAVASAEAPKGGSTGAVQNTSVAENTTLDGKTMGQVVNDLDKGDLKKAYKAIDAAYDIHWGKDGISDTQAKLEGLQGKVGEHVYDVLKLAMQHCKGKLPIVKAYFAALCKKAEEYLLSRYVKENREEKPISEIVPLWPQYKTSFLKGIDLGMSPDDTIEDTDAPRWPTAAKFRTEVQKREREAKGGNAQAPGERNSANQTATQLQLVTKGWSPQLSASMSVLCQALNRLTHEEQDKFAPGLLELAAQVETYANEAHREAVGDTRTENQRAVGAGSTEDLDPGTRAAMQAAIDKDGAKNETKGKGRKAASAA